MENKINVADLLMGCPEGMELDCTLFDDVVFERVDWGFPTDPIILKRLKSNTTFRTNKYGHYYNVEDGKCIIFPKGKTSWEGFEPPHKYKYKNGDIVITALGSTAIINEPISCIRCPAHCVWVCGKLITDDTIDIARFATKSEKAELFKAIKENGYHWNDKTKTLEKLTEPKFKVGDTIRNKKIGEQRTITRIYQNCYECDGRYVLVFENQNNWELVPDKFNITTLKPFDKVLIRDLNTQRWAISLFGYHLEQSFYKYCCMNGAYYAQCIPYEGNEHLLGTMDDCEEQYKIWK